MGNGSSGPWNEEPHASHRPCLLPGGSMLTSACRCGGALYFSSALGRPWQGWEFRARWQGGRLTAVQGPDKHRGPWDRAKVRSANSSNTSPIWHDGDRGLLHPSFHILLTVPSLNVTTLCSFPHFYIFLPFSELSAVFHTRSATSHDVSAPECGSPARSTPSKPRRPSAAPANSGACA